jgi:hypothetical protein
MHRSLEQALDERPRQPFEGEQVAQRTVVS